MSEVRDQARAFNSHAIRTHLFLAHARADGQHVATACTLARGGPWSKPPHQMVARVTLAGRGEYRRQWGRTHMHSMPPGTRTRKIRLGHMQNRDRAQIRKDCDDMILIVSLSIRTEDGRDSDSVAQLRIWNMHSDTESAHLWISTWCEVHNRKHTIPTPMFLT